MANENKIVAKCVLVVEQCVSKKGTVYKRVCVVNDKNEKRTLYPFMTEEIEFALFKAGIKIAE